MAKAKNVLATEVEEPAEAPDEQPAPKHKYFADQLDDEEVLFTFRKHMLIMRNGLLLGSVGLLLPVLYTAILIWVRPNNPPSMAFFFGSLGVGVILGAILMFPSWVSWYFSVYIVTDQRFIQIHQKGLFHRSVVDISLKQIQMVNYQIAGFQQTLLGFGTIMIQTYMGDLVIHHLHAPGHIQKRLTTILRDKGIISVPFPGTEGGGPEPMTSGKYLGDEDVDLEDINEEENS